MGNRVKRTLVFVFGPLFIISIILIVFSVYMNSCSSSGQLQYKHETIQVDSTEASPAMDQAEEEQMVEKSEPAIAKQHRPTSAKPHVSWPKSESVSKSEDDNGSLKFEDQVIVAPTERVVVGNKSAKPKVQSHKPVEEDNGMIVYKVPDTMSVLQQYTALVRISRGKVETKLIETGLVNPTTGTLKTADKLTVTLVDASDTSLKMFQIQPITSELQVVEKGNTYTEWQFSVIPQRSGEGVLRLVVSIPKNGLVKQVVYTDNIKVKANASLQFWAFIQINWKWIVSICLMPIITLIIKAIIDRFKKKED